MVIGGKNKYWINSCIVPNKKVADLFCSVQMNVNNPHFIIMQGRVTKVLNMKPGEILAMLEEAAGTRMYESKKQATLRTMEKKTAKMDELNSIINEEISPRLEKLRNERESYINYTNIERELITLKKMYDAYLYYASQRYSEHTLKMVQSSEREIQQIQDNITHNEKTIEEITEELCRMSKDADEVTYSIFPLKIHGLFII